MLSLRSSGPGQSKLPTERSSSWLPTACHCGRLGDPARVWPPQPVSPEGQGLCQRPLQDRPGSAPTGAHLGPADGCAKALYRWGGFPSSGLLGCNIISPRLWEERELFELTVESVWTRQRWQPVLSVCSSLPPTVLTGLRFWNMNCPNWTSCLVGDCKLKRKVSASYWCPAILGAQTFLSRSPGLPWVGFGALSQMRFQGGMPPLSGVLACLDLERPGRSGLRAGACRGLCLQCLGECRVPYTPLALVPGGSVLGAPAASQHHRWQEAVCVPFEMAAVGRRWRWALHLIGSKR